MGTGGPGEAIPCETIGNRRRLTDVGIRAQTVCASASVLVIGTRRSLMRAWELGVDRPRLSEWSLAEERRCGQSYRGFPRTPIEAVKTVETVATVKGGQTVRGADAVKGGELVEPGRRVKAAAP